jgi:hypothetical protein
MGLPTRIVDGTGTKREAAVTEEHALLVSNKERIAIEISAAELTRRKLFFEFFRRDSDDSRNMTVDGSTTPQEFILKSESVAVRWIEYIRIIIEGNNFDLTASGDFRRWGSVASSPGLTNGIELYALQGGTQTDIFYDPVQNMGDLFYYQTEYNNFINAVDAQADFLSVDIEMPQAVALPLGIEDKIVCKINDNLVHADFLKFQILAKGYQEVV